MSDFGHDFVVVKLVTNFAVIAGHGHHVIHRHHGIRVVLGSYDIESTEFSKQVQNIQLSMDTIAHRGNCVPWQ